MTLFYNGIEVWGSAIQKKYLDRIDKFFRRAYRYMDIRLKMYLDI
jgi:hypothetical protein